MRASVSKSATAAANSSGARTFRPSAQPSALAVRPAAASFGHDLSQTPVHAAPQPRMLPDFPYAQKLESAFSRNIPGRALIDEKGCEQRAVPAFTDRTTVHFASPTPPLRVAAHEAVHVLQHSGLSRDAHLGPERHADSVSRLIVRGASARHLLSSEGAAVEPAIRLYTEFRVAQQRPGQWDAGGDVRVSDDGKMAVRQDNPSKKFYWAEPDLIAESNRSLASKESVIRLHPGGHQLTGPAYDDAGGRHRQLSLSRVVPLNLSNRTSGPNMKIWADCGRCARNVMGAGQAGATAKYSGQPWHSEETTAASAEPKKLKQRVFNKTLGGWGDKGERKYEAMSPEEKDRFDERTGINEYAAPSTGEGFVIASGGNPVNPPGTGHWNFHWAGVVTSSGHDRVTLDNLAVGNFEVENDQWEFQMFGPAGKPGQTFYEQFKGSLEHGDAPTVLRVGKR